MFGHSNLRMVHVYPLTKFEANIFINAQRYDKKSKSKMAAAAILNFRKSVMFGINDTRMANVFYAQNLVEVGPEIVEIHPFKYFQDGGRRPSWTYYVPILDHPQTTRLVG